ncbi:FhaA domain-containing protein [Streptomyces sp. NPDC003032]
MGVLKKFEQRLEGLVNGTFAKVFKSEVQPVEIAGALQRECDNNATIWNRERTVVPNDFIVELSAPDFERLSPYSGQLGDELSGMVRDYAKQQRYSFMGPIKVHLEKAEDLDTGLYRVRSRTLASSTSQSPERAPAGPGSAGPRPGGTGPGSGGPGSGGAGSGGPGSGGPAAPGRGAGGGYGYPQPPSGATGGAPGGAPPMPAAPPPGASRPGGQSTAASRPAGPGAGPLPGAQVRRWIEINGNRHQISRPTLVLGRSTDADVRIDDPGVSRRHCEIRTGTPSTIQDLGSTNGIVVDGQHTTRATLRDGSRIVVGQTTIVYRQAEG